MRWKKRKEIRPDIGDTKIVEKFLWWPACLNDEWRWLERVVIEQEFREDQGWILYYPDWVDVRWID